MLHISVKNTAPCGSANENQSDNKEDGQTLLQLPNSSFFSFYRTLTCFTSPNHPPQMIKTNSKSYLLIPNEYSYFLYDLETLKLIFFVSIKDTFKHIPDLDPSACFSNFLLDKFTVIAAIQNYVIWYSRGTISHILKVDGSVSNLIKIDQGLIIHIKDGDILFMNFSADDDIDIIDQPNDDKIVSNFCTESFRINQNDFEGNILNIHSLKEYQNKILIISEYNDVSICTIYNYNTRKSIFTFNILGTVSQISHTVIKDVLGLGMDDGRIIIYDIKKNKEVFLIKNLHDHEPQCKISGISFMQRMLACVLNNVLFIYDLEMKKIITRLTDVLFAQFIAVDLILVVSFESIAIYEFDGSADDKLRIIKSRTMIHGNIDGMKRLSDKELIVWNTNKIFKINLYRDEENGYINKNNMEIENIDIDGFIAVKESTRLTIYGDLANKFETDGYANNSCIKLINELKVHADWIRIHRDFCMVGVDKQVFFINICSKREVFVLKVDERVWDGDFGSDKLVILTEKRILAYTYEEAYKTDSKHFEEIQIGEALNNEIDSIEIKNRTIRMFGNVVIVHIGNKLQISCGESQRIINASAYSLDLHTKYLSVIYDGEYYLYDLVTGLKLEHICCAKQLKDVVSIGKLKFIVLIDVESGIHVLANKSVFVRNKNMHAAALRNSKLVTDIEMSKKETSLYSELLFERTLAKQEPNNGILERIKAKLNNKEEMELIIKGLEINEVKEIIRAINNEIYEAKNTKREKRIMMIMGIIPILKRLILFRNSVIEKQEIEEISVNIEELWREYQEGYLETIGLLSRMNIGGK